MVTMTSKKKATVGFMVAVGIAILAWDLYVAGDVPGDTISEVTLTWAQEPFRGFIAGALVGMLMGHLFWPQQIQK